MLKLSKKEFDQRFSHLKVNSKEKSGIKRKVPGRISILEEMFWQQILALKLQRPEREYKFVDTRQWRFDFAWPEAKFAVEVEGGTLSNGRHVRPKGFQQDYDKYNAAVVLGWRVLRFTSTDIKSGLAISDTKDFLENI